MAGFYPSPLMYTAGAPGWISPAAMARRAAFPSCTSAFGGRASFPAEPRISVSFDTREQTDEAKHRWHRPDHGRRCGGLERASDRPERRDQREVALYEPRRTEAITAVVDEFVSRVAD